MEAEQVPSWLRDDPSPPPLASRGRGPLDAQSKTREYNSHDDRRSASLSPPRTNTAVELKEVALEGDYKYPDNNTPAWLQEGPPVPAKPADRRSEPTPTKSGFPFQFGKNTQTRNSGVGSSSVSDPANNAFRQRQEPIDLHRYIFWLRGVNMIWSAISGIVAGLIIWQQQSIQYTASIMLCIYIIYFSLLVILFDSQWDCFITRVGDNYGFLYTATGRMGIFFIQGTFFIGLNLWYAYVCAGICGLVGLANLFILCKWPGFTEKNLRKIEEQAFKEQQREQQKRLGARV